MELARERRPDIYRLDVWRPEPLVPRHLRFDIAERTLADGTIEQAVDTDDVAALAAELAERGIEAIAICFLHSFANADNERAAREAVERAAPDLRVAISSDVAPEIREYERTQTTAASVYVQDRVVRYLEDLEERLTGLGAGGRLRVMLSNGGVATARDAADRPIRMLESGPGRRRARGRAVRGPERLPRPDVVRHGRHDGQAVPDRGRPPARHARVRGRAHRPLHARVGPADQDADDRHDRDRRRRRVARARRHARAARVRAGVRGRRPRPRVLRRRRRRSRRSPTPTSCSATWTPGSSSAATCRSTSRPRATAIRDAHRRAARAVRRGGGVGHPPPRQRGHGQRRARARRRARPRRHRPAAVRVRRRRAGARVRRRRRARHHDRDRARGGGRDEQRRRARRAARDRRRAQPRRAGRRRHAHAHGAAVRRARAGGRRGPVLLRRDATSRTSARSTCATSARASRSRSRSSRARTSSPRSRRRTCARTAARARTCRSRRSAGAC